MIESRENECRSGQLLSSLYKKLPRYVAEWTGSDSFTELQIWRSSGDGSYTKVGSTTIMTEENTTQLYEYPLSSPLPFLEGDIYSGILSTIWIITNTPVGITCKCRTRLLCHYSCVR